MPRPGSFDVTSIVLNPKRRFTVRLLAEAAQSGVLTFQRLASALASQLATQTATVLPVPEVLQVLPQKYIKLKHARAWGPPSEVGKRSTPTRLAIPLLQYFVEPTPTKQDVATGQSDRAFDSVKGQLQSWGKTDQPSIDALTFQNVCILDVDVEVW